MIQEKMNVLEQVGLSESNISDKAECSSFHSKVGLILFFANFGPRILLKWKCICKSGSILLKPVCYFYTTVKVEGQFNVVFKVAYLCFSHSYNTTRK